MDRINFFSAALAAITNSTQIPFSSWFPATRAAPAALSALVNPSALVTPCIYLFIHSFRHGANFEYNLKKIIALRQFVLIIRIFSTGFSGVAFFLYQLMLYLKLHFLYMLESFSYGFPR
jgi:hypothetical protein